MTPMNRPKVLVADDDFDIRELERFLLELEGYEVISAGNGYEALGAAVALRPDLVVLDVMMPGENGYLVSRAIREHTMKGEERARHVPILLVTARDLRDDPERERSFLEFSGADDVIYKPFDTEELTSRVNRLLGGAERGTRTGNPPPLKLTEVEPGKVNGRQVNGRQVDGRQVDGSQVPAMLPIAGGEWNPSEMFITCGA